MKVAYIGNFGPEHSTENHVARAFRHEGHEVTQVPEGDPGLLRTLTGCAADFDFVLWTRTKSLAAPFADSYRMLLAAHRAGVPVAGYHLDIWWGLQRESEVVDDPFFRVDLLITADGGHPEEWRFARVNHLWMPPAVSFGETEPGMWRSDMASPLVFVGSHDGGYHQESQHRHQLVHWLKTNFARDCAFYPRPGEHAVRGAALRDLYASVDVVIGDSAFTGTGLKNYWSDRIPETIGRGGYLLHPFVEGLVEQGFTSERMGTWEAFDWDALGIQIDWALSHPSERKEIAAAGRQLVLQRHTYEVRVGQIIAALQDQKLLKRPKKAAVHK